MRNGKSESSSDLIAHDQDALSASDHRGSLPDFWRGESEFVVAAPQYRAAANTKMGWKNANLRCEMTRLLRRAGVSGWPRLFHSMRASRQKELQREFPLHVVCSWLGNSPRIAQQSYLLVTEDDFAKAAGAKKMMVEVFS